MPRAYMQSVMPVLSKRSRMPFDTLETINEDEEEDSENSTLPPLNRRSVAPAEQLVQEEEPECDYSDSEDEMPSSTAQQEDSPEEIMLQLVDLLKENGVEIESSVSYNQGHLDKYFDEKYGQGRKIKGYCTPLCMKWLFDRAEDSTADFVSSMKQESSMDQMVILANDKILTPHVLERYATRRGFKAEAMEKMSREPGLYQMSVELADEAYSDSSLHSIALHVISKKQISFFDPNVGEFSFASLKAFSSFLKAYLGILKLKWKDGIVRYSSLKDEQ